MIRSYSSVTINGDCDFSSGYEVNEAKCTALAFSQSSSVLAAGWACEDGKNSVVLFDANNGKVINQIDTPEHGIHALCFSVDDKQTQQQVVPT